MGITIIERAFRPILGRPCWGVEPGRAGLTLHFGAPHIVVREPEVVSAEILSLVPPRKRREYAREQLRRKLFVFGEWHLVIWGACEWSVRMANGVVRSRSATERLRKLAAEAIDSQALESVALDRRHLSTSWAFETGEVLRVRRLDRVSELWSLFQPDGRVLSLRADGFTSHAPETTPGLERRWRRLPDRPDSVRVRRSPSRATRVASGG